MVNEGSYDVNPAIRKDTSFRSFICALLVFLALCVIIYLALALTDKGTTESEEKAEADRRTGDQSESGKKEYTTIRPGVFTTKLIKTIRTTTTPTTTTTTTTPENYTNENNQTTIKQRIRTTTSRTDEEGETTASQYGDRNKQFFVNKSRLEDASHETTTESIQVEATDGSTSSIDIGIDGDIFHLYSTEEENLIEGMNSTTQPTKQKLNQYSNKADVEQFLSSTLGLDKEKIILSTTPVEFITTKGKGDSSTNTPSDIESTTEVTREVTQETTEDQYLQNKIYQTIHRLPTTRGTTESEFTEDQESSSPETISKITDTSTANIGQLITHKSIGRTTDIGSTTEVTLEASEETTDSQYLQNKIRQTTKGNLQLSTMEGTTENEFTEDQESSSPESTSKMTATSTANIGQLIKQKSTESTTDLGYTTGITTKESTTRRYTLTSALETSTVSAGGQTTIADRHLSTEDSTVGTIGKEIESTTVSLMSVSTLSDEVQQGTTKYEFVAVTHDPQVDSTTAATTVLTTQKSAGNLAAAKKHPSLKVCDSTGCKRATSKMLHLMNHDANPCDNFFDFACGGQQSHEDASGETDFRVLLEYIAGVNSSAEKYLQDFKNFYTSCVDHEWHLDLNQRMQFLNDTPTDNLTEFFVELLLTQSMPLFDVGLDIGTDRVDEIYTFQLTLPGHSALKIDIKGWSVMEQIREKCFNRQKYVITRTNIDLQKMYESYKSCQKKNLRDTAHDFIENVKQYFPNHGIYNDATLGNMLDILEKIQDLMPGDHEILKAQQERSFKTYHLADLRMKIDGTEWRYFLEPLTFNSTFDGGDPINVYFSDYLNNMFTSIFTDYTERQLTEALWLYSRMQLYVNTVIPKELNNRELYCMDLTRQLMPDVASTIAYELSHNDKMQQHINHVKMMTLFGDLKDHFEASLNDTMKDKPREMLVNKLRGIILQSVTTGDQNASREHHKDIEILNSSFQGNVVLLLKNYRNMIYSLAGFKAAPANLLTYFVDPFSPRPVSFYQSKYIVLHPAASQKLAMKLPEYLQLATVGLHLSMELTKHFDPRGRYYFTGSEISDSDMFYNNLVQQTSALSEYFEGNMIDGYDFTFKTQQELLYNEMIADNAAMRLITDTVKFEKQEDLTWIYDDYPAQKALFIIAAQELCKKTEATDFMRDVYEAGRLPSPLKIQNVISNSAKFAEEFQCREGAAMTLQEDMIAQFPFINYDDYDYTNAVTISS